MRRTLQFYFLRRFIASFLSTLAMVFALAYLIDLIELSRRGRFEDIPFSTLAMISALRVPSFVEQAFPFIVLFASIFTLLTLNRRMELTVARASGVSIWQILAPFLFGATMLGLLAVTAYNPLASLAQANSARIETLVGGGELSVSDDRPPWLRQDAEGVRSIIGARAVADGGRALGGVAAFIFDADGNVSERIDARGARLVDGAWEIDDATVTRIGYPPEPREEIRLPTELLPEYVEERIADPQTISIWQLGEKIRAARSLGYDADAFAMRFHTLIAMPALFAAMVLVAATVAVRYARIGQSGPTIVLGIAAGFVLYVVNFLAQALGSNALAPAVLAAWFPVVAAGLLGTTILLHQEDG
ncbi:LPS export ABC transporter permease LptG [Aureimonas mangrovi]|uniref:LPS export ABC transporter permease LptG n=1 Tax=Aureimonas mangrovi TaxID=2758041 RepID=UPI00163D4F2F|nr:LPS export ABC transporter permease LptG [Aureimonas mangrovi]